MKQIEKKVKGWDKEFDKRFVIIDEERGSKCITVRWTRKFKSTPKEVKIFIKKLLQDTREEVIKDFLSKMLGDKCKAHGEVSYCVTCEMWELYDDYKLTKKI